MLPYPLCFYWPLPGFSTKASLYNIQNKFKRSLGLRCVAQGQIWSCIHSFKPVQIFISFYSWPMIQPNPWLATVSTLCLCLSLCSLKSWLWCKNYLTSPFPNLPHTTKHLFCLPHKRKEALNFTVKELLFIFTQNVFKVANGLMLHNVLFLPWPLSPFF